MTPGRVSRQASALSGGGIRSASFCLGALQGLESQTKSGIEGVDYLSTVSGGGYVGCALTATTQKLNGQFPFTSSDPKVYADTPSVRHIRDYSNYLIPHGAGDVITALVIAARGLAANALIVLPILLFFVGLTLFIHPDKALLEQPMFHNWNLADVAAALGSAGTPAALGTFRLSGTPLSSPPSASFFFWFGRSPSRLQRLIFGGPGLPGEPPGAAPN